MEALVPPGGGPPPHIHTREDETFYLLEGAVEFLLGETTITAGPGDFVNVPRGTVHHIKNVGSELSLRMAIAMPPAVHYYEPCEQCGYDDTGPREWCA